MDITDIKRCCRLILMFLMLFSQRAFIAEARVPNAYDNLITCVP